MNNGWISVYENEKPNRGEVVLVLSYAGEFPAPEDLFHDPMDRAYAICSYYCSGDEELNEAPAHVGATPEDCLVPVTFDKEGFYVYEPSPAGTLAWRYIKTIKENPGGIVCWKRLDWPAPRGTIADAPF